MKKVLIFSAVSALLFMAGCSGNQKKTGNDNAEITKTGEGISPAGKQLSNTELENTIRDSLLTIYEAYLPDTISPTAKNSLVLSQDSIFQLAMYNFEQRQFIQEPIQGNWYVILPDTVCFIYLENNPFISNKAVVDYNNKTLSFDTPSGKLIYKAVP